MNGLQALAFLEQHQPLPANLPEPVMEKLCDALVQLRQEPVAPERAVPLLLNCWDGSNEELNNEGIIFTLKSYPKTWVAPHVATGLKLEDAERRIWFGEVACAFPDTEYLSGLTNMLGAKDTIERFVAACALERIGGPEARQLAKDRFDLETDPEIQDVLEAILAEN